MTIQRNSGALVMGVVTDPESSSRELPDPVRSLIERELRHRRRQLQNELHDAKSRAFSQLRADIRASIQARRLRAVFPTVPLRAYKEMVTKVRAITDGWPTTVWEVIKSIIEIDRGVPVDGETINAIVDEFAWSSDQRPFTLAYIDIEAFLASVAPQASAYGLVPIEKEGDFRALKLEAAASSVCIMNSGWEAREATGIAIERYRLAQLTLVPVPARVAKDSNDEPKAETHPLHSFRVMENLIFEEIHIRVDPERLALRISARGREVTAPFSAIGLTRKNEVTLNRQGEIFMAMANGTLSTDLLGADRAIHRLSASLRESFDTSDPPFSARTPKFQLSIPKDKAAKRQARRRNVPYDDQKNAYESSDPALEFLKKNDPNYDPNDPTYSDSDIRARY